MSDRDPKDDTGMHLLALMDNSAPDVNRPRVRDELELQLVEIDKRDRHVYTMKEHWSHRLTQINAEIKKGPPRDDERKKV